MPPPAPESMQGARYLRTAVVDEASWKKWEALSGHLPHFSASAFQLMGAQYEILGVNFQGTKIEFPAAIPQSLINLDASLDIFDGLGTINRYRAALQEGDADGLQLSRAKLVLDEDIRLKFYQALASRELETVSEQNIKTLEEHLALAKASETTGMGTRFDVLRINAQLEEARAEKTLTEDNVVLARKDLVEAMGLEQDSRELNGTLPIPNPNVVPKDLAPDVMRREDIQAQMKLEKAEDRASAASSSFWWPTVSVFAEEQYYAFGNFNPLILPSASLQNAYSIGLRFTWNVFDGGASLARQEEAGDRLRQAEAVTREALLKLPADFELWKRRYFYNVSLYQARTRTVEESEESVRLATLGVKAGTRTHSEVLDSELELFRARAGLVRAQEDAEESLIRLELALGKKLE